jgi:hypothetical protein
MATDVDEALAPAISRLASVLERMCDCLERIERQTFPTDINNKRQWYPSSKAYSLLGYDNYRKLWNAVDSGLLRIGKEVSDRRKPNSSRPVYYFHIQKCIEQLQQSPAKRSPK